MILLMIGNPIDGMEIVGPFDTMNDATGYGHNVVGGRQWLVVIAHEPSTPTHTRDGRELTDTERHQVAASLKGEIREGQRHTAQERVPRDWRCPRCNTGEVYRTDGAVVECENGHGSY